MQDLNQRINASIEYVKEEVTIRVESIKGELDKLNEKMHTELDEAKLDLVEYE